MTTRNDQPRSGRGCAPVIVYIREPHYGVRAIAGGMVVTDDSDRAHGTMLILQAPDRTAAMRYLEGDPYWEAGLFARFEVDRWDWGLGKPQATE